MDHSCEISNVTVIHANLDHLETGEEDGEEIELSHHMDEGISIGGKNITIKKQASGNQLSPFDLQGNRRQGKATESKNYMHN